jgi:hypothetical protein
MGTENATQLRSLATRSSEAAKPDRLDHATHGDGRGLQRPRRTDAEAREPFRKIEANFRRPIFGAQAPSLFR